MGIWGDESRRFVSTGKHAGNSDSVLGTPRILPPGGVLFGTTVVFDCAPLSTYMWCRGNPNRQGGGSCAAQTLSSLCWAVKMQHWNFLMTMTLETAVF